MPQQANQPLPDGYQLENYRIASVLSCGGFSIVYLAYDENDQPVAIKEYLPSQLALRKEGDALPSISEENLATFRYGMRCFFEEGRSLARLSHPNVVRVLNFFRANETVYMVMRYERGRTLQEHIRARRGTIKERFIRHVSATKVWNGKYSRQLLETIDWCLELDHLKRPQSVFALQKVLLREKDPEVHRALSLIESVRSALMKRLGR